MIHRFQDFVAGITACYKYIQRIKSMEMTELGLKGTHGMCLFYLYHTPAGLPAGQLCQLCGEDKAAISRTVAELQSLGYIAPQPASGKKYRLPLRLTPAGQEVGGRLDAMIEEWVQAGGDGLTEADRESFYRSLAQIAANLRGKMQ